MPATVLQMRSATDREAVTCCKCGVEFASPVIIKRRDDGDWFYCPNGHTQHFTKTTEAELREELQREKNRRESAERDAEWNLANAKNARIAATKAQNKLKKIETRVNAGVCPHCNRTFQQLARHMECKHPKAHA